MKKLKNDKFIDYKSTGKFTICEDYCVKTQAEVDQILKNCADIYMDYLRKKAVNNGL